MYLPKGIPPAAALLMFLWAGCGHNDSLGRKWVHKIRFHGNKKVSAGDIKGRIGTQQSSGIPFTPKKYLDDPFMIDTDKERIEAYYRDRGLYGAKVTSAEVRPYDTNGADVHFTIKEGEYTRIADVKIEGLESLGRKEKRIRRTVRLRPGQIFEHPAYLLQKEAVEHELKQLGYAWAKVEGEVDVNRDARSAAIRLRVAPGPQAVLGEIRVQGTRRTNPRRLAYHCGLQRGEPFRQERIDEAQGRLYNLGVFSAVKIEYEHDPQHPQVANVTITVSESTFHELRLGIGVALEVARTDFRLQARYTKHNFLGGLRTLQLTARPGYAVLPALWTTIDRHGPTLFVESLLTQPDLLGRYSELRATADYEVGVEYAFQYHGPRLSLGVNRTFWANRIQTSLSYQFQYLGFFNSYLEQSGRSQYLYGLVEPYLLGYLQQTFTLDLRDRQLDARKGFYLGLTAQEGGIYFGGLFQFESLVPDVRGYVPLGNRIVLAGRIMFGQLWVQGDRASPITQRFYLGGPNSHRGFSYNRLSMQVCTLRRAGSSMIGGGILGGAMEVPCNTEAPQGFDLIRLPIGGDQQLLLQGEARVHVFHLFGQWVSLVGFVDAGDVAAPACVGGACGRIDYLSAIDFRLLHVAVGGGLRYQTIVGTIRADLGVRLNRLDEFENTDSGMVIQNPDPGSRLAFHISIGEAF